LADYYAPKPIEIGNGSNCTPAIESRARPRTSSKPLWSKRSVVLPSEVHLIATVHDELTFDCPSALALQYSGIIRAIMEDVFHDLFGTEMPIEVEAKTCQNWVEK
jgi:hypothetical protein